MNRFKQFQRLLTTERRVYGQVTQVRADGTTVVQLPDKRVLLVRGTGIPRWSYAFVRLGGDRMPQLDGVAPELPLTQFMNL